MDSAAAVTVAVSDVDTLRRVEALKLQLESAQKQKNHAQIKEAIGQLRQLNITMEMLQITRIAQLVNTIRKDFTDSKLKAQAKELIVLWRDLVTSGKASGRPTAQPSPVQDLSGLDCPPNPTTEYTPYTVERRWQGVDGYLGANGRWYRWVDSMPRLGAYVVLDQ